jgi:hypothetical protein
LVGTGLLVALSGCGEKVEYAAVPRSVDSEASGSDVAQETGSTPVATVEEGTVGEAAETEIYLEGVTFQNGLYVATGAVEGEHETDSVILTSEDAQTWSLRYRGGDEVLAAVAFGGGHWVVAGWGIRWVGGNEYIRSQSVLVSEDALTWQEVRSPSPDSKEGFHEVVWAGSEFLMHGDIEGSYALWASETGTEWTERGRGAIPAGLAVGVPGVVGHLGAAIALTNDAGLSWSQSSPLEERRWVAGLWAEGDGFGGTAWYDCCAGENPNGFSYYSMHSPDGLEWSLQNTSDPAPAAVARIGQRWVGRSVESGFILYRGANEPWQVSSEVEGGIRAVTAGNKFVAVGHGIWNSEDGVTWVPATVPALDE